MMKKGSIFVALWVAALAVAGCSESGTSSGLLLPQAYKVDLTFQEFYDLLGGEQVLGPAISPMFTHEGVNYQYTITSLLVYDPNAPASQQFTLGALGKDMGIGEPAVPPPDNSQERYVEGHIIFSLFVPHYEALGGSRYTGAPLTEVHFNPEKNRYEQFFANLGFYWVKGDHPERVNLLAYGAWKCDAKCRSRYPEASTVALPFHTASRFSDAVMRLGAEFTGYAITDEYLTPDGYYEQVFENVVLISAPEHPDVVFLRAVPARLGFRAGPLSSRSPKDEDFFYGIQGEQGYNIPNRLYNYILQHGGFEVSGPPIGSIARVDESVYQQCFTNLCIQAYLDSLGKITVRPTPLGYSYRRLPLLALTLDASESKRPIDQLDVELETQAQVSNRRREDQQPESVTPSAVIQPAIEAATSAQQSGELVVRIWEGLAMVSNAQSQEIGVSVFQDGQPVANVEPDLTLTLPGNIHRRYYMVPTGEDGQSRLLLDPVAAESGTLIPYKVCICNLGGETVCMSDSFLIWNSP